LLNLGCLNGIPPALRADYTKMVAEQAMPGVLFLLSAHLPVFGRERRHAGRTGSASCGAFRPERRAMGSAPQDGPSMWTWLRRLSCVTAREGPQL